MSAESPVELDALACAHLDGELVGEAWREAQASHGAALEEAVRAEQRRRAAIATLPRSALPTDLRAGIMATIGDRAPASGGDSEDGDESQASVIRPGPRWWWAAAPALLAAALVIAVWPLLSGPPQSPEEATTASNQAAASSDQTLARGPEAPPAERRSRQVEPAEAELLLDLRPDSERGPERAEHHSAADGDAVAGFSAPTGDAGTAGRGRAAADDQPEAGAAAKAPAPAASAPITEDEFAALADEADRFRRASNAAKAGEPLPADVTREALAVEMQRQGTDRAEGEATLEMADAVVANDETAGADELRLGITMGLIPAEHADGVPELEILLVNRGRTELAGLDDLLELQGLDAHGEVVWRTPAPGPAGAMVDPGGTLRWRLPLDDQRLPPAAVTALRLASGTLVGDALPLE